MLINEIISAYKFDNFIPSFSSCIEKNDFWQIRYLRSGKLTVNTTKQSFKCQAGQLVIIPPNEKIILEFDKNTALHYSIVSFRCKDDEYIHKIALLPITLHGINQINFNDFVYTSSKIYADKRNNLKAYDQSLANYHCTALEAFILRLYCISSENDIFPCTYKPGVTYNDDISVTKKVKDYITDHIGCDLSLDILAKEIGVSKNTVMRKFRADTGMSIMQYFTKMKIEKAINMICDTDLSLKSISEQLNFQSPAYFSTVFKKQMGISPIEFSKRSLKWKGCLSDFC